MQQKTILLKELFRKLIHLCSAIIPFLLDKFFWPDAIKNKKYYEFGDNKTEQTAKLYWDKVKGEKGNG